MQIDSPEAELSVEDAFQMLEEIAERLESRDITLEESFSLYQKGMQLLKSCSDKMDLVEKKMLQINKSGELSEF